MAYIQDHALPAGRAEDPDHFDADVVVIGAGLAGLAAAAFAARAGARVVVLERSETIGGRAATHARDGFLFNVGPHALYAGCAAAKALAELGVSYTGRRPPASGGLALHGGRLHALPGGFVSLLTTDLLSLAAKLEFGKALASLAKVDAESLRGQTLEQWLASSFHDPIVRQLVEALMRLTAYASDPSRSCAAASVTQLQAGMASGVLYVDGGWTTLTAGLAKAAEAGGASIRPGSRVRTVKAGAGHVEVTLRAPRSSSGDTAEEDREAAEYAGDGPAPTRGGETTIRARVAVLAVPPAVAAALVEGDGAASIQSWAADAIPVKAACLDLGLRRLPDPRRLFVLGVDRPLYFSVHSASARLAPEDGALVHVAKYLGPEPADAKEVEAELEAFCDLVQPGWREEVVERRYLPSMLVTGALVAAGRARPGPDVPGSPSLLVAGDWVGSEGMIADAAMVSGREAGLLAAARVASMGSRVTVKTVVAAPSRPFHEQGIAMP